MSTVRTITSEGDFTATVLNSSGPVVVDFGAPWCPPCRILEAVLERLVLEYSVPVVSVDTSALPELSAKYPIQALPTLLVFEAGVVKEKMSGYQGQAMVRELLGRYSSTVQYEAKP